MWECRVCTRSMCLHMSPRETAVSLQCIRPHRLSGRKPGAGTHCPTTKRCTHQTLSLCRPGRSSHPCAISPVPARISICPWKFSSPQAAGKPELPFRLLPPPHSALAPSVAVLGTPLRSARVLPAMTPPRVSLLSCCCVDRITTSLFWLLHWGRRGLRLAHESLHSQSSSFCLARFKNSLSTNSLSTGSKTRPIIYLASGTCHVAQNLSIAATT